jgi:20S proteasome alpha/beta subunit
MTVAIAAVTRGSKAIVTATDARLSYNEAIPASDSAALKTRMIAKKWALMFAAQDATAFTPVVADLYEKFVGARLSAFETSDFTYQEMSTAAKAAYENEFSKRFVEEHLSRFKYSNVTNFRQDGYNEMGKDLYYQYAMELAKYDLGLELLGYGFDSSGKAHIYEIANPGKISSHNLRGFAAIGSGTLMALASLNRKPMSGDIQETIYRVLDAKFSAETAPNVGYKTYVIVLNDDGNLQVMTDKGIEAVRKIWTDIQKQAEPVEAIDIISTSLVSRATTSETKRDG